PPAAPRSARHRGRHNRSEFPAGAVRGAGLTPPKRPMQTFDPRSFDPYRALGLPRGATSAQIKKAHRALAKRYHPDTAEGDTVLFLGVQEAYRVLSDPLLRRDWDVRHEPGPVRATAPGEVKSKRPRPTP